MQVQVNRMKVLAFEDSFDIAAMLISAGIDLSNVELQQLWTTDDYLNQIKSNSPDILLLDHFIPPTKGLEVLQHLNHAVTSGDIERPEIIVGMSSASMANERMLQFGADYGVIKFDLSKLPFWKT